MVVEYIRQLITLPRHDENYCKSASLSYAPRKWQQNVAPIHVILLFEIPLSLTGGAKMSKVRLENLKRVPNFLVLEQLR
jgi:hypothetical protein